jgi:ABC-type amino acid transport substrate-binding protein
MSLYRLFHQSSLAIASMTLAAIFANPVAAQTTSALDSVMSAKLIKIAVPTDFPPYGFVGVDLKPQGLDVDTANYIGQNWVSRSNSCRSQAPTVFLICKPNELI